MRYLPLALVLAACRAAGGPPPPPPPPAASLSGGRTRYEVTEHRHVEQAYQDQPIVTDSKMLLELSIGLAEADSGYSLDVVLDSVTFSGDATPPPGTVVAAIGARLRGQFAHNGGGPIILPIDPSNAVLDQVALGLRDLLPPIPPGGATPGARWADSTTFEGRSAGVPITITTRSTHEAGPWSTFEGTRVLSITSESSYALEGAGDRVGQWIGMRGTGVSVARCLITPRGEVALGTRRDSLHVDVEIGSTGLTIPVLQVRVDTVRRVLP